MLVILLHRVPGWRCLGTTLPGVSLPRPWLRRAVPSCSACVLGPERCCSWQLSPAHSEAVFALLCFAAGVSHYRARDSKLLVRGDSSPDRILFMQQSSLPSGPAGTVSAGPVVLTRASLCERNFYPQGEMRKTGLAEVGEFSRIPELGARFQPIVNLPLVPSRPGPQCSRRQDGARAHRCVSSL